MPELPEVETIARGLAEIVGACIRSVHVGRDDYVRAARPGASDALVGRRLGAVRRHGKRLTLGLEPAGAILVHLGMSGQLTLAGRTDPLAPHTHLRISLDVTAGAAGRTDSPEIRLRDARRFGGVWIDPDGSAEIDGAIAVAAPSARDGARPVALGPDALAIRLPVFRELLRRHRRIKALLLDQHAIAGLGNIYCDEALWAARIHPLTRASDLSDAKVADLHRQLRRILKNAIRHGGSTLRDYRDSRGDAGRFQRRHRVYGREGEPCPRCDTGIRRIAAGGRSSHVCRRCQRPTP